MEYTSITVRGWSAFDQKVILWYDENCIVNLDGCVRHHVMFYRAGCAQV